MFWISPFKGLKLKKIALSNRPLSPHPLQELLEVPEVQVLPLLHLHLPDEPKKHGVPWVRYTLGRFFLLNGHCGLVAFTKKNGVEKTKWKKKVGFLLELPKIDPSERLEVVNFIGGCRQLLWKVDSQNGSRVLGLQLDMVTSAWT